jgi:uncharacterized protein YeaO (DUF488 family)
MQKITVKRIYETDDSTDGSRILVDKLWPRGISKERANLVFWAKDVAPSTELRKKYNHDSENWPAFRDSYFAELDAKPDALEKLKSYFNGGVVTFLFSSKELELNNAVVLREYVENYLL